MGNEKKRREKNEEWTHTNNFRDSVEKKKFFFHISSMVFGVFSSLSPLRRIHFIDYD